MQLKKLFIFKLYFSKLFYILDGNERADRLAREGAGTPAQAPEPLLGLPPSTTKQALNQWVRQSHEKRWVKDTQGCLHTKLFMETLPSPRTAKTLLKLKRKSVKAVTEFITGHCRLNKHLSRMGLAEDPSCRLCGEGEETPSHFLEECEALGMERLRHFGQDPVPPLSAFQDSMGDLLGFIRSTGIF